MNILLALVKGFSASSGLIMAIGAQNAFVIRQGLRRRHLMLMALMCSSIDAVLITFGVLGFGYYIADYPLFISVTKYLAAVFLGVYGMLSLRSAFKKSTIDTSIGDVRELSAKQVIAAILALSLLNPHVYLDTVILLGSIASQQPSHEQIYFAFGAIGASFAWFFTITFGAKFLTPFFQREYSWRIIDGLIAIMMWAIAWSILDINWNL